MFSTSLNSSTIYASGVKPGEALISLQLAIEYPQKYYYDKNYFNSNIMIRVTDRLMVGVPESLNNPEKTTSLYLMPPNTYSKIETNKKTRLRLGYSQQSVFDYSTNSY